MEPSLPTSFIPKRPISSTDLGTRPSSHATSLLSLLTGIVVVTTGIAFAGVYLYGASLENKKNSLQQTITQAKDGLGADFVADMKRLSARIDGVKTLIKNHIVISPIFDALTATTLRSVEYSKFEYSFVTDTATKSEVVNVKIQGNAKSYATIALQSDAYRQSKLIKNPVFSNLTVDDKTGRVGFSLEFTVNPSDLSYQTFIDSKSASGASTAAPSAAPSPAPAPTAPATTTPAAPSASPASGGVQGTSPATPAQPTTGPGMPPGAGTAKPPTP
jgi:hypothetical protein